MRADEEPRGPGGNFLRKKYLPPLPPAPQTNGQHPFWRRHGDRSQMQRTSPEADDFGHNCVDRVGSVPKVGTLTELVDSDLLKYDT